MAECRNQLIKFLKFQQLSLVSCTYQSPAHTPRPELSGFVNNPVMKGFLHGVYPPRRMCGWGVIRCTAGLFSRGPTPLAFPPTVPEGPHSP